jgi:glycosyltransferase involved in cell wall biosynthesis
MAHFTGGCHQSLGCQGFAGSCDACPQVRPVFQDLVRKGFANSPNLHKYSSQITCVAPTIWMRNQAAISKALGGLDIEVIENPVDPVFFKIYDRDSIRSGFAIPADHFVACLVADQVQNPAKRVMEVMQAFSDACSKKGISGTLLVVGGGANHMPTVNTHVRYLGSGDSEHVAKAIAIADVLLSGSIAESAGMTIREAGAQGVPVVVVSNGGSDEMIVEGKSGYVVEDFTDMTYRLIELMSRGGESLRDMFASATKQLAADRSSLEEVSRMYLKVYENLDRA